MFLEALRPNLNDEKAIIDFKNFEAWYPRVIHRLW